MKETSQHALEQQTDGQVLFYVCSSIGVTVIYTMLYNVSTVLLLLYN